MMQVPAEGKPPSSMHTTCRIVNAGAVGTVSFDFTSCRPDPRPRTACGDSQVVRPAWALAKVQKYQAWRMHTVALLSHCRCSYKPSTPHALLRRLQLGYMTPTNICRCSATGTSHSNAIIGMGSASSHTRVSHIGAVGVSHQNLSSGP